MERAPPLFAARVQLRHRDISMGIVVTSVATKTGY
jgi:hypothetical protein